MLKVLRKRKRSWIIFAILGAIIIVFIFWGIGTFRIDKRNIVARVNGKAITATEYTKAYERQINYYRNLFKDQFTDELLERMNLKQNTLQMLINTELVFQEAKKQGISVSVEDVQKTIQAVPAFQRDGVFDKEQYLQVLKANRMLPGEYEKAVHESLIIEQAQKRVTDAVTVTDKEIEDAFMNGHRKINLQYLAIDAARFEKTAVATVEDSHAYFEKHKNEFKVPAMVKAAYLSIPFKDLLQKVEVKDAEVRDYYEKNKSEFQTGKEVAVRHILIRPASGAQDINKAKEEAKKKADEVLALVKKGKNFSELAKKYSTDTGTAKQGGYLGYFKQGVMVKPFEDAVFSLKKGEISGVVETDFGYHIIKAEDIKEARLKPYKEAKVEIEKNMRETGAKKLAAETASEIQKAITSEKKDLKNEALKKKLKFMETGFFSERDSGGELVMDKNLNQAVFSLKIGETSGTIETNTGVYIIKVLERKEEHIPAYEEVAAQVKIAAAKEKTREKAKEAAEAILKKLTQGEALQKLASKEGYTTGETGFFTKSDGFLPPIRISVGNRPEIFSLSKENPYYHEVIQQGDTFYLFKLKAAQEADKSEFEAKKAEMKNQLLQERQQEALKKWLTDLRSKAKIEINEEAL